MIDADPRTTTSFGHSGLPGPGWHLCCATGNDAPPKIEYGADWREGDVACQWASGALGWAVPLVCCLCRQREKGSDADLRSTVYEFGAETDLILLTRAAHSLQRGAGGGALGTSRRTPVGPSTA